MKIKQLGLFPLSLCLTLSLAACSDDPEAEAGDETGETTGTDTNGDPGDPCMPADDPVDESSCSPDASDYVPGADDDYPACISDGGTYELYADPPGSIARIEAGDEIADLLWRSGAPTVDDFTAARTTYELDEGLGSRVERREDLHYPPVPEAEWDPGLDPDKQCSNTMLAEAYPDRCAGPAKLRPLINQAFIDGMSGTGDPNVNAAKIKAALFWFYYLSVYKEAYTCTAKGKDCDSSWAYYTGGAQVEGDVIGFAGFVSQYSDLTHQRIFDGILAVRCFRDLYSNDDYPTYDDLPEDGKAMFDMAWEQLDEALQRGFAIVLRQHLLAHDTEQCSGATAANWSFIQVIGEAFDRELRERDASAADELMAIWGLDEPTSDDIARAVELIDELVPCP